MSRERLVVTIGRDPVYGAWVCSAIVGTQRVHQRYYGYTKREAVRLFRAFIRES